MAVKKILRVKVSDLTLDPNNARKHGEKDLAAIVASLEKFSQQTPIVITSDNVVIKGNGTLMAAMKLGWTHVDAIRTNLTGQQITAYAIADNRTSDLSSFDNEKLLELLQGLDEQSLIDACGFDEAAMAELLKAVEEEKPPADDDDAKPEANAKLTDRFLVVPFSVLNAREGWWQDRKRAWLALGIKSELGRGENGFHAAPGGSPMVAGYGPNGERLTGLQNLGNKGKPETASLNGGLTYRTSVHPYEKTGEKRNAQMGGLLMQSWTTHPEFYPQKQAKEAELGKSLTTAEFIEHHFIPPTDGAYVSGTSIFDPVLCELAYRWFSPVGGQILDPFAGGSVRGIVASKLGRKYTGLELRAEQVSANESQGEKICDGLLPVWHCTDSRAMSSVIPEGEQFDFVFSCPPYADLEVYSDDPLDISTMPYEEFIAAYRDIIAQACSRLRVDRFACVVVGDVRDSSGNYRNFVGDTVEAFCSAGLSYYNEAILVTAVGSLPIRVGKQFSGSRKFGKTHQNVLVFVKGDGKRASEACGEVDVVDAADMFGEVVASEESNAAESGS